MDILKFIIFIVIIYIYSFRVINNWKREQSFRNINKY